MRQTDLAIADGGRFTTLEAWLEWQQGLHPSEIALGLDRPRQVASRLAMRRPAPIVFTVGGTNGKGSCVAMLESMLRAAGYCVGTYTSPHLLRYNERVRIDGNEVQDFELCQAFERVDRARGEVPLTYFEFGTLAALDLFGSRKLDVAVLEVGLGGRLDAVNLVDADVALISSIGIDHVEWLGNSRSSIGLEKAGIFRAGRAAVIGDENPPATMLQHAAKLGTDLYRRNTDFRVQTYPNSWDWSCDEIGYSSLPRPSLSGDHQISNAAATLMALNLMRHRLQVHEEAVYEGLKSASLAGRFQVIPGPIEVILDVCHNPDGARVLSDLLRARRCAGQTHIVVAMLTDKDGVAFGEALAAVTDHWHTADLGGSRGRSAKDLTEDLRRAHVKGIISQSASIRKALREAYGTARRGDRIVVCGSFHTVAAGMRTISEGL